nr:type I polyketide synthase [Paenibacillus xylanexedens]
MEGLYQFVLENTISGKLDKSLGVELIQRIKQSNVVSPSKDVAVIGMAVRMPSAQTLQDFWGMLASSGDCISEFPATRRRDTEMFIKHTSMFTNYNYSEGAYLKDIDHFDCSFFNLSPREAELMDPHQRLFLETAWQVIEDGGYGGDKLKNMKCGVYVGYSGDFSEDYKQYIQHMAPSKMAMSIPGNIRSIIASRISYLLNLKGPSMLIDTACSSSLTAIHLACQGLFSGDCELAIAGGVKLKLLPLKGESEGNIGIASSSGRTYTYDKDADGTGFGEGIGVVLLKPLTAALRDKDRIYAVIKGSAINQDGASIGITAPNALAQTDVIEQAWKNANIHPETISFIETHGTATKLGDPIEIDGIDKAFRKYTTKKQFCAVSTIKTNVGHLDHAAGIAGFIKAVLALWHEEIPANVHFREPNRKINFVNSPVYVADRPLKWERNDSPRRCGISSFGLSGTNCHVVLEEAPLLPLEQENIEDSKPRILALSARTKNSLITLLKEYAMLIERPDNRINLNDLCYTALTGRGHYEIRIVFLFTEQQQLVDLLNRCIATDLESVDTHNVLFGSHKIVANTKEHLQDGDVTNEFIAQLNNEANRLIKGVDVEVGMATLTILAEKYVKGATIDWTHLYQTSGRTVGLPVYPFDSKRLWVVPDQQYSDISNKVHPLLGRLIAKNGIEATYLSEFETQTNWLLHDHIVAGKHVLPGTGFLEMARQAAVYYYGDEAVSIENMALLVPLQTTDSNDKREVRTVTNKRGEDVLFTISSRGSTYEGWVDHASGKICRLPAKLTFPVPNIGEKVKRLAPPKEELDRDSGNLVFNLVQLGLRWDNIQRLQVDEEEAYVELTLPSAYQSDLEIFRLHPAMLDNALNAVIHQLGEGSYLPLYYKKVNIYGDLPAHFNSIIRKAQKDESNLETFTFDISLTDRNGKILAEFIGYTVKRVHLETGNIRKPDIEELEYCVPNWLKVSPLEQINSPLANTIVFGGGPLSEQLSQFWKDSGWHCDELNGGKCSSIDHEGIVRFLAEYKRMYGTQDSLVMIYLASEFNYDQDQSMLNASVPGIMDLHHITNAILKEKPAKSITLLCVGQEANQVIGNEELRPSDRAMLGFGRVIGQEYAGIQCKLLDTDGNFNPAVIAAEVAGPAEERIVAYRNGDRYIESYSPIRISKVENALSLHKEGVYIITGGLGGLGLKVAEFFASHQAKLVALISRTPLPPRKEWDEYLRTETANYKVNRAIQTIMNIEEKGTNVFCFVADVSEETELQKVLSDIRKLGEVKGIVHAAGSAGKGFVFGKSREAIRQVMLPKVCGTQMLDRLTLQDPLDFFVLFSSITAVTGGVGQADYTAANCFMDAYAAQRKKQGVPIVSINWPAWREVGMAYDYGVGEGSEWSKGISTFSGLHALEAILQSSESGLLVLSDDNGFKKDREVIREKGPLSQDLNVETVKLKGRDSSIFKDTETIVAKIWASVLGLEEIDIYDHFFQMGGDSVMAAHLLQELEIHFPGQLDISDIFTYSSVYEMSNYIGSINNKEIKGTLEHLEEDDHLDKLLNRIASGEVAVSEIEELFPFGDEDV